jgi:hypothetical protein
MPSAPGASWSLCTKWPSPELGYIPQRALEQSGSKSNRWASVRVDSQRYSFPSLSADKTMASEFENWIRLTTRKSCTVEVHNGSHTGPQGRDMRIIISLRLSPGTNKAAEQALVIKDRTSAHSMLESRVCPIAREWKHRRVAPSGINLDHFAGRGSWRVVPLDFNPMFPHINARTMVSEAYDPRTERWRGEVQLHAPPFVSGDSSDWICKVEESNIGKGRKSEFCHAPSLTRFAVLNNLAS